MGIFDGPLFDFNGDGKTDAFEFAMAMRILKDIEKEKNQTDESMFTDEDDEEDEYSEENDEDFDDWL